MYGRDFKQLVSWQCLSLNLYSRKSTYFCYERLAWLSLGLQYDTYFVIMEEWKMIFWGIFYF